MALEKELALYERIKSDLLLHHEGKFVLIIGEEQLGIFDKSDDAYKMGIALRGNVPMLIKQISKSERTEIVPALILGLTNVHL